MLLGELSNLICRKGWDVAPIMAGRGIFCNPVVCDKIPTFSEDCSVELPYGESVMLCVLFRFGRG